MRLIDLTHPFSIHTPGWVGYPSPKLSYFQRFATQGIVSGGAGAYSVLKEEFSDIESFWASECGGDVKNGLFCSEIKSAGTRFVMPDSLLLPKAAAWSGKGAFSSTGPATLFLSTW